MTRPGSDRHTSADVFLSSDAIPIPESGHLDLRPFRIVSLLYVKKYQLKRLQRLATIREGLLFTPIGALAELPKGKITSAHQSQFHQALDHYKQHLKYLRLDDAVDYLKVIQGRLSADGYTYQDYEAAIQVLQDQQDIGLKKIVTGFIPASKVFYFHNPALFGEAVNVRFPSAVEDMQAAGTCYAHGLNTACVFHLMRVSEFGLRHLAAKLKVKLTDRGKTMPVEYATWDKVIKACKSKIDKIRLRPVGPKRQAELELYSDAADHCLFMKDIWRNNASHTRKPYNEPEANAAMERVKDFMKFLAATLA